MDIQIGFEKGSGDPVKIPLMHCVISGITRAGKSTTLETLIDQAKDLKFLILDVKTPRDYGGFNSDVPVFLENKTDPLMLKRLLEARSRIFLRREFPEITEVQAGWTFEQAYEHFKAKMESPKVHPVVKSMLKTLCYLLRELINEMAAYRFTDSLEDSLTGKLNVMDMSGMTLGLQQLVVHSCLGALLKRYSGWVVVVDEAHRFVPERKPSAARDTVTTYIAEGAAKKNYLWLSDQTITGVDKDVLKQMWVWILGKQTEINEAKRTLDQIPFKTGISAKEVQRLPIGHFIVCTDKFATLTYIQPKNLPTDMALQVARDEIEVESVSALLSAAREEPSKDLATKQELRDLEKEIQRLGGIIGRDVGQLTDKLESINKLDKDMDTAFASIKALDNKLKRIEDKFSTLPAGRFEIVEPQNVLEEIVVRTKEPEITVEVYKPKIILDDSKIEGKLMLLYLEGFFNEKRLPGHAGNELLRRGYRISPRWVTGGLVQLVRFGLLQREKTGKKIEYWNLLDPQQAKIQRREIDVN